MVELGHSEAFLDLIRHGPTVFEGTKRIAGGLTDVSLNEEGYRRAIELSQCRRFNNLTAIHSTPLQRGIETVRPLAEELGLPIEIKQGLRERSFGREMEELTDADELEERRAKLRRFWRSAPAIRLKERLAPDMDTDEELLDRFYDYAGSLEPGEEIGGGTHWDLTSTVVLHTTKRLLIDPKHCNGVKLRIRRRVIDVVDLGGHKPVIVH